MLVDQLQCLHIITGSLRVTGGLRVEWFHLNTGSWRLMRGLRVEWSHLSAGWLRFISGRDPGNSWKLNVSWIIVMFTFEYKVIESYERIKSWMFKF